MGILVLRNLKDYDENEENVVSFFLTQNIIIRSIDIY